MDKTRQDKTRQDKTRQDKIAPIQKECQVVVLGQMDNTIDHTFESANRVYDKNQLCPTIPTCGGGGIQPKVIDETKSVGGLSEQKWGTQYHQQDRVYKGDIALALPANIPGGSYKYIVAMRGRNPDKPTDRTAGKHTEQRLEKAPEGMVNTLTTVQKDNLVLESAIIKMERTNEAKAIRKQYEAHEIEARMSDLRQPTLREDGCTNTLTTVQKDNLLMEESIKIKQATKQDYIECKVGGCFDSSYPNSTLRRGRVQEGGDVTPTITAQGGENINYVETRYRIRKLTPRECWRLMGYTDEDFDKAESVNSNTQLYKESGNAIVKQVLMAIFLQLGIQGKKKWNDMTIEEREKLVRSSVFDRKENKKK